MASVQGIRELKDKFTRASAAAKKAAISAVVDGAKEVVDLQKKLVPVDQGDLRDSIVVTPPGQTTPPYSQPGGQRTAKQAEAIITAGNTKVRYAHLVEFGTAPHKNGGEFAGTQNPGFAAEPFFWPSWRALRPRVRSRVTRSINKAIKDEFSK